MSKQKNTGPSERELLLSRIKNLVIGSVISGAALLLGILVHIDFIAIPALLILAGSLSGLLSHLLQLRRRSRTVYIPNYRRENQNDLQQP